MTQERPKSTRLELGEYFADIVQSTEAVDQDVFFWIVQKKGFPEVLRLGQNLTFDEAETSVKQVLQEVNDEDPPRRKKAHL